MSVCFCGSDRLRYCWRLFSLKTAPLYCEPIPGWLESKIAVICSCTSMVCEVNVIVGVGVLKVIWFIWMVAWVPLALIRVR